MENGVKVELVEGVEEEANLIGSYGGKVGHASRGAESHQRKRSRGRGGNR